MALVAAAQGIGHRSYRRRRAIGCAVTRVKSAQFNADVEAARAMRL